MDVLNVSDRGGASGNGQLLLPGGALRLTPASGQEGLEVQAFFDGDCPLCLREVRLLQRLDRRGRIGWVDIAGPGFDPAAHGKTLAELMDTMHAQLPDGRWVTGVEVFRRLYAAVGLGPLVAITRLPGLSHLLDAGYRVFARNRLRLTGRCRDGECAVPRRAPRAAASLVPGRGGP